MRFWQLLLHHLEQPSFQNILKSILTFSNFFY